MERPQQVERGVAERHFLDAGPEVDGNGGDSNDGVNLKAQLQQKVTELAAMIRQLTG